MVTGYGLEGPVTAWIAYKDEGTTGLQYATMESATNRLRKRARWERFREDFRGWFEWVHWRYCATAEPTRVANVYEGQVPDDGGWIKIRIVGKMLEVYYESSCQRSKTCA